MEDFIKKQEAKLNIETLYIIMCDDVRRPKQFQPDMHFSLWETEKMAETIQAYESLDLKYDLVIQVVVGSEFLMDKNFRLRVGYNHNR